MNFTSTVIASILGLLFGGFPGFILGLSIGFAIDSGMIDRWRTGQNYFKYSQSDIQHIFFNSTFQIMGYVAKADGRVSEKDIQTAEKIMHRLGLDKKRRQAAIQFFEQGKQNTFKPTTVVNQLKQACWYRPSLLRTFLEIQIQMAFSEGHLTGGKRAALRNICQQLGLIGFNFDQFEQRFRAEQNYGQDHQEQQQNAYDILGVTPSTNKTDIKKAYRRLMSRYHPDKLIAKGLPEDMIKVATEKTQRIKKAYEDICRQKAWNT